MKIIYREMEDTLDFLQVKWGSFIVSIRVSVVIGKYVDA